MSPDVVTSRPWVGHEQSFRAAVRRLADYEPGRSVQEVSREYGIPVAEIVKLASNENPYGPSPSALLALLSEVNHLHLYPWQEFTDLKECVAEANGVPSDNVVLGSGSESIVQMIPRLYIEPGDEAVVAPQTYARYAEGSLLMNAVVRTVPLRDYHFDLERMAAAVGERTKIIWLCSPNNPTGTILRLAEMQEFLGTVPETVAVVIDQAYCEFVDDPQYADGLELLRAGHRNVIVLRTFSKAYALAGLRLGYALADAVVCRMLERIEEPFFLNRMATAAGPVALADHAWLARTVAAVGEERARVSQELALLGCSVVPSQANFILADVHRDGRALAQNLMRSGVIVRPADGWGYPTHIRVTVGTPDQNTTFLRVLAQELRSAS